MSAAAYLADDPIFAALQALHCPEDELADALGIDIRTLWGYQMGNCHIPPLVLRRLIAILYDRAECLRDLVAMLEGGRMLPRLAAVS